MERCWDVPLTSNRQAYGFGWKQRRDTCGWSKGFGKEHSICFVILALRRVYYRGFYHAAWLIVRHR